MKGKANLIKVCINSNCGEVYHNCAKKDTRCPNCGMYMGRINQSTYLKKFSDQYWQFDYQTKEIYRPKINKQMSIDF